MDDYLLPGRFTYETLTDEEAKAQFKAVRFFSVLDGVRSLSKDTTKVGAVALGAEYQVLSVGYNGFPRKVVEDDEMRKMRPEKYYWFAHAEENLVAQAALTGTSLKGSTILVAPLYPCTTCSRLMIQSGVKTIITLPMTAQHSIRWAQEASRSFAMLYEAGLTVLLFDAPANSFQRIVPCPPIETPSTKT